MARKNVELGKLSSELFVEITNAEMSLSVRPNVMAKLFGERQLVREFNGFFHHLFTATATHSFMLIARMFDEPTSRLSVTLEDLVGRVAKEKVGDPRIAAEAAELLAQIRATRKGLARVRNTVFAHRVYYPRRLPNVQWEELESAKDLARRILDWYGREYGQAYSYRVPGFDLDCERFVEAQLGIGRVSDEKGGGDNG